MPAPLGCSFFDLQFLYRSARPRAAMPRSNHPPNAPGLFLFQNDETFRPRAGCNRQMVGADNRDRGGCGSIHGLALVFGACSAAPFHLRDSFYGLFFSLTSLIFFFSTSLVLSLLVFVLLFCFFVLSSSNFIFVLFFLLLPSCSSA